MTPYAGSIRCGYTDQHGPDPPPATHEMRKMTGQWRYVCRSHAEMGLIAAMDVHPLPKEDPALAALRPEEER